MPHQAIHWIFSYIWLRFVVENNTKTLLEAANTSLMANYRQPQMVMVSGRGSWLKNSEGTSYLDFSGGIAVLSLGHAHPKLARAIADQAATLIHTSNLFYTDKAVRLAAELCKRSGFSKVYFTNSGAESNEALIKIARKHAYLKGDKSRTQIIATHQGFHGRTMGAVSVTGQPKYHEGFGPMLPDVVFVPYNDIESMRAAVDERTAGVLLEPVQAEGGIINGNPEYFKAVRELTQTKGALLLLDEVQTGIGRTGTFLAKEWLGIMPDACALAKGIGGGFPLGAMLVTEALANSLPTGSHGSTYGGNPLACAAGLAVLQTMDEENILHNVNTQSEKLRAGLQAILNDNIQAAGVAACTELRGTGLLLGLKVNPELDPMSAIAACREEGLLLSTAGGDVLRFSPPLTVQSFEVDLAIDKLRKALPRTAKKPAST